MPAEKNAAEFKREERYIIIKRKDLNAAPFAALHSFLEHLESLDGLLPARQFLVIESDWPEYEPAWAMIEARMTGQPPALGGEPDVFSEDQWWMLELDAAVAAGTPDQKRAVAVVRNLINQHAPLLARVAELERWQEGVRNNSELLRQRDAAQAERDTLKARCEELEAIPGKINACRECGSKSLTWETFYKPSVQVAEGRLRTNEVQCQFVLGCDECSETLSVVRAEAIASRLTAALSQAAPAAKETYVVEDYMADPKPMKDGAQ